MTPCVRSKAATVATGRPTTVLYDPSMRVTKRDAKPWMP
jgi:hypothetical protein